MTMERVHVWEETVTIPTYPAADPEKSPLFLENRAYCNLRRAAATGAFASGHPAEPNGHLH